MEEIKTISLTDIFPSQFNPRKKINADAIRELAESIKSVGIIQPLTVRPIYETSDTEPVGGKFYEIVCGHRRYQAAKMAGLEEVPCLVRPMTPEQARELMITENLQREDVDMFDEATAIWYLRNNMNMSANDIAAKLGKSVSYIYSRLRLTELNGLYRELYDAKEIPASHCLFIAQLTPKVQETLYNEHYASNVPNYTSYRKISLELLRSNVERLTCSLDGVEFDTSKCVNCPANTLTACIFPEQTRAKCLNAECFNKKNTEAMIQKISCRINGKFFIDEPWNSMYKDVFKAIKDIDGVTVVRTYEYDVCRANPDDPQVNGYAFNIMNSFAIYTPRVERKPESPQQTLSSLCRARNSKVTYRAMSMTENYLMKIPFEVMAPKNDDGILDYERLILMRIIASEYRPKAKCLEELRLAEKSDGECAKLVMGMDRKQVLTAMMSIMSDGITNDYACYDQLRKVFPDIIELHENEAKKEVDNEIRKMAGVDLTDEDLEEMVERECKAGENDDNEEEE